MKKSNLELIKFALICYIFCDNCENPEDYIDNIFITDLGTLNGLGREAGILDSLEQFRKLAARLGSGKCVRIPRRLSSVIHVC